jgi:hypothetical protein
LGQNILQNKNKDLNENSSDAEGKKKLKAKTADERAYSALTLLCSEATSFRI